MTTRWCFVVLGALLSAFSAMGQNTVMSWWSAQEGFSTLKGNGTMLRCVAAESFIGSAAADNISLTAGFLADARLRDLLVPVVTKQVLPLRYSLDQNYPNPFNPSTIIRYQLPKASIVKLSVYDVLGREVSVLINEQRNAGIHEVRFKGQGLSSGVYFYRLEVREPPTSSGLSFIQTKRLLLLK